MKRLLPVALLLFVCLPVMAGDIQEPGKQPPPPPPTASPSTNVTTSEDTVTSEDVDATLTEIALWLLAMINP